MKVVRVRAIAEAEMYSLGDYIAQDNLDVAVRFLDAVVETLDLIAEQPCIGALRYSRFSGIKGLRTLAVNGFDKHLILYVEHPSHIDILRILHSARDILSALVEGDDFT